MELRAGAIGGDLSVGIVRLPAGTAPGHAPEALEQSQYVDFSPSEQFDAVLAHVTSGAGAST